MFNFFNFFKTNFLSMQKYFFYTKNSFLKSKLDFENISKIIHKHWV